MIQLRNSQIEEMQGKVWGKGAELPCPLQARHPPQISTGSPIRKPSESCPLGFYGGFIS